MTRAQYMPDLILANTDGQWTDSRGYTSVNAAVTAIGATSQVLVISQSETIASNLAIPANVVLQFARDGVLSVSAGVTLTIYSPENIIASTSKQLFSGAGSVVFTVGGTISAHAFGFSPSESGANNLIYLQNAIDSIKSPEGTVTILQTGTYTVDSGIAIYTGCKLIGTGRNLITLVNNGSTAFVVGADSDGTTTFASRSETLGYIEISGLGFSGNGKTILDLYSVQYSIFSDLMFVDIGAGESAIHLKTVDFSGGGVFYNSFVDIYITNVDLGNSGNGYGFNLEGIVAPKRVNENSFDNIIIHYTDTGVLINQYAQGNKWGRMTLEGLTTTGFDDDSQYNMVSQVYAENMPTVYTIGANAGVPLICHVYETNSVTALITNASDVEYSIVRSRSVAFRSNRVISSRTLVTSPAFQTELLGDAAPGKRFAIDVAGEVEWGDGTSIDLNLYRSGAGILTNDYATHTANLMLLTQDLAYSTPLVIDLADGASVKINELTGDLSFSATTNAKDGSMLFIKLKDDGSGRNLTWDSEFNITYATMGAGKETLLMFHRRGGEWWHIGGTPVEY